MKLHSLAQSAHAKQIESGSDNNFLVQYVLELWRYKEFDLYSYLSFKVREWTAADIELVNNKGGN